MFGLGVLEILILGGVVAVVVGVVLLVVRVVSRPARLTESEENIRRLRKELDRRDGA